MNDAGRVTIEKLPTGTPGLDDVLGGGIPEYSFNLIAGEPGSGKTTLAQQIAFANATPEQSALYMTVLGEPSVKMLRYQQQFSFFETTRVGTSLHYVSLRDELLARGLNGVLERIVAEVEARSPAIVIVDSFRTLVNSLEGSNSADRDLQMFVQRLAMHLTSWQVTSFLIGEYRSPELESNAIFTIADGIIWLTQELENNSSVRKLQVVKMRGQEQMPGLHTFKISQDGLRVFPRISLAVEEEDRVTARGRASIGVPELDAMMDGGIPVGDSVLIAGPTGSGKSILATHFIAAGVAAGEAGVLIVFEEHPKEYLFRAEGLGFGVLDMVNRGMLETIYLRPLDLSPDETLYEIREAVQRVGARRVVIDSMSGFELALAPTFRAEFRESLYRLVGALTGVGITVVTTMEQSQHETGLRFTPNMISFLADDLIILRYVEIEHQLRKVLAVAKMRGSQHSKDFREYEITSRGLDLLEGLEGFAGRISGAPHLTPGDA